MTETGMLITIIPDTERRMLTFTNSRLHSDMLKGISTFMMDGFTTIAPVLVTT